VPRTKEAQQSEDIKVASKAFDITWEVGSSYQLLNVGKPIVHFENGNWTVELDRSYIT